MGVPPSIVYVAARVPMSPQENIPYTTADVPDVMSADTCRVLKGMRLTSKLKSNGISWCFAPIRAISKRNPRDRIRMPWDESVRISNPAP